MGDGLIEGKLAGPLETRITVTRTFTRMIVALIVLAAMAFQPAAAEEDANDGPFRETVSALLNAIRQSDEAKSRALTTELSRVQGNPGNFVFFGAEDNEMLADAALRAHEPINEAARTLLRLSGGAVARKTFLVLLESGSDEERLYAASALQVHGDPRIGPALLEAYVRFRDESNYLAASKVAYVIGTVGFEAAGQVILRDVTELSHGAWWTDPVRRQVVPALLQALSWIGYHRQAGPVYNEIVRNALPAADEQTAGSSMPATAPASPSSGEEASPEKSEEDAARFADKSVWLRGLPESLFVDGTCLWNLDTVRLFNAIFAQGDRYVVGCSAPGYPPRSIMDETSDEWAAPFLDGLGSLQFTARDAVEIAYPWVKLANPPHIDIPEEGDLDDLYVQVLNRTDASCSYFDRILWILAKRKTVFAFPAVLSTPNSGNVGPRLTLSRLSDFIYLNYLLGELRPREAVRRILQVAEDRHEVRDYACSYLLRLTGENFGYDWDKWRWWVDREEKELTWNVQDSAFGPKDKWLKLESDVFETKTSN